MQTDSDKFEELIGPIEDRMIRVIGRILYAPDAADDAMQNALAKIWRQLLSILEHPNPQAMALRICMNAAYDILRGNRTQLNSSGFPLDATVLSSTPRPDEAMEHRERRTEIVRRVGELPAAQQTAVYMRYFESSSFREIAELLNCEEATCRKHVELGRKKLSVSLAHMKPTIANVDAERQPQQIDETVSKSKETTP